MKNFTLTPVKTSKRDPAFLIWLAVVHAVALAAPFTYSPGALAAFAVLYFVTGCLGVTLGFHRLLTHKSFRVPRWLERTFATFGVLALQGSVVEWIGHHRMHHAATDSGHDPHDAHRGFWFTHVGWMTWRSPEFDDPSRLRLFARDIYADPYLLWISKTSTAVAMQAALAVALFALGGVGYVVWGVFLRLVAVYHATWLVNSAAHRFGYRNFETRDLSRNCWWVALAVFGEGWHNNHHAEPGAVHVRRRWWEVDVTWIVISVLASLGLARNLHLPSPGAKTAAA